MSTLRNATLAAGLAVGTGCAEVELRRFDGPFEHLAIETVAGEISVRGTDPAGDGVELSTVIWGDRTDLRARAQGRALDLETRCGRGLCAIDYDVDMPRDASVDLVTLAGDVWVGGIEGGGFAYTADGRLEAWAVGGEELDLVTGQGPIEADHLRSEITRLETDVGDIHVTFDTVPSDLVVTTGIGDVWLWLPVARYDVDVDAGGFVGVSGLLSGPPAGQIRVFTGIGSVYIRGY